MSKHYEDDLSIAVADFLRLSAFDVMWWHSPNGGKRNAREGARLKRMGVLVGVPDYIFILPDNSVAFIELKLAKTAFHSKTYQSKVQKEFEAEYRSLVEPHDRYMVCRSVDEVAATLTGWGIEI